MSFWDSLLSSVLGGLVSASIVGLLLHHLQRRTKIIDQDASICRELYSWTREAIHILELEQKKLPTYKDDLRCVGVSLERVANIKHRELVPRALKLSKRCELIRKEIMQFEHKEVTVQMLHELRQVRDQLEAMFPY